MLIGKWTTILGMAAEAELIHIGGAQIVAGRATMGIVAINTAHFAFAQRVMVGQAELRFLRLVTPDAGFVGLRQGPEDHIGLRHRGFGGEGVVGSGIESESTLARGFHSSAVNLVTIHAAHPVGGVRAGSPVAYFGVVGMAA